MSPELCEDKPYNQKSDVWALGCVLYEITTRKHAFNGQNLPALVLKILKGNYPPIPSFYSINLSSLISSMLQKDPELRPSIGEILSLPFIQEKVLQIIRKKDSLKVQQQPEPVKPKPQTISPKQQQPSQQPQVQPQQQAQQQIQSQQNPQGQSEEKSKWLEDKQSELNAMFKQLHPSKQNPINTINRLQIRKQLEEKDEKKKEKMKGRKEYYEQILEKRKGGISVSASVQNQPMQQPQPVIPPRVSMPSNPQRNLPQQQPSRSVDERIPRAEERSKSVSKNVEESPRVVNIAGEDKMVFRLDEIKNQAHKRPSKPPPKPQPVVISQNQPVYQQPQQPVLSKEDERKEIKKKQEKERQEWLVKNGVQPDDKKKKFLAEKQDEKKKKKEEERKKMLDHKKKMDAIKGRKNQIRVMFGLDESEKTPEPVSPVKEEFEPTPEDIQKKREEEEKERVRKEKADMERKNFRDFIKNQKKKKKEEPSPFDAVIPSNHLDDDEGSLNNSVKQETVVIVPKKQVTPTKVVSPLNKTASKEVIILEPKSKPETPQKEKPSPKSSPVKKVIDDDLDLLPTREEKVVEQIPELCLTPSTLDREAGLTPELKFHTPVKKSEDTSQMSPSDLEMLRKKQHELSVRIEALRNYCEQKFGEKSFIQIYNLLRDFEFKENEDEDSQIQEGILQILGNNTKLLPYVQKIHQLIFCEDLFYG